MVDIFAHTIWSFIIFRNIVSSKEIWFALFFGALPDLASWTIYMFYAIIKGEFNIKKMKKGFKFDQSQINKIPKWAWTLYGISHSIFICGVVLIIIYLYFGNLPWWLLAWPIHILMDIPTHSKDFFPTPFLWPISDYAFPGISWGSPIFMILNWTAIILYLIYIFFISS